jgi:hypothetical protein
MPHVPLLQVATPFVGTGHWLPHAPQWLKDVRVFTQAVPHLLKPALHAKPQLPELQLGAAFAGATHTSPQTPQFDVSVWVVTQEPLQFVVPDGQEVVQAPPAHT